MAATHETTTPRNGQETPPRWATPLTGVLLAMLVGLFLFAHGCGNHDHDDELMLPAESRPMGQQ